MRTETDILGSVQLPDDCLYGINTARAAENFALERHPVNSGLLEAIVLVKKAAALTYQDLGIRPEMYAALAASCDEVLEALAGAQAGAAQRGPAFENPCIAQSARPGAVPSGAAAPASGAAPSGAAAPASSAASSGAAAPAAAGTQQNRAERIRASFPVDALQGGAGTSTNMNVNEVLANLTLLRLGRRPGEYSFCHPLNDVNRGQSTNDVYPTALRVAAIRRIRVLSAECAQLQESLQKKENAFEGIPKLGRTELMDAVPITLGEEFGAYAQAIARDRWRIYKVEERLRQVNLGGAAVGQTDLSLRAYRFGVIEHLRRLTDMGLAEAEYPMDPTQNQDVFVEVSGLLKALAVNLMKIAGDLRLMASGPHGGLGEVRLRPLQQGSTVMPGKVNPVLPEMVLQLGTAVLANDTAISAAAAQGEFELNALLPLIADSLLDSLALLTRGVFLFRTKCVDVLEADEAACRRHLDDSSAFAAHYLALLGYDEVSCVVCSHAPAEAKRLLEQMAAKKSGAKQTDGKGDANDGNE